MPVREQTQIMILMVFYIWRDAKSGLTAIIPLTCILASILFFSILNSFQGPLSVAATVTAGLKASKQHSFFSFFFFWDYFINGFFFILFISWRLITLQYCSGFCHTLTCISHGVTCIPHPDPTSHLPLHLIPLGLPSAPGPNTCLMHPTWAGDLFHPR